MVYEKRCDNCNKLFPSGHSVKHKEKLCKKCWDKARSNCIKGRKGDKKFGQKGNEGGVKIETDASFIGYSKDSRKALLKRNREIDRLREINNRLSKQNIKLKEQIACSF